MQKLNFKQLGLAILMLLGTFSYAQHTNHENHDNKNENSMMNHDKMKDKNNAVLKHYLELKNALVADNNSDAAKAGKMLAMALKMFETSKFSESDKKELDEIIEVATEHAEHIIKSDIAHQREHFKQLSQDMIDFVEITQVQSELFVQYCPMYDKGSSWLSSEEKILNPYYGSKMLTCGKVQKKIN